jgi:hypothetical protein
MWIIPKQLHTLACAPDTEALNLGLNESSQICAQSLFVRSKPSPARTWLQKWKRDSWSQHLFGRILKPSLGNHFVTEWTSLLEVTPANHFPQQEKDLAQKTQDIFGLSSQAEFGFYDPSSASLKTSKDISVLDSERSLESWNQSVIKRRGEYSQRVKSAHLTRENESSSWPTIRASEYKDTWPIGSKSHDHMLGKGYLCAVVTQDAANWLTPDTSNHRDGEVLRKDNNLEQGGFHGVSLHHAMTKYGPAAPANPSTDGSRRESWLDIPLPELPGKDSTWATPTTCNAPEAVNWETFNGQYFRKMDGRKHQTDLSLQVKGWATPQAKDHKSGHRDATIVQYKQLNVEVEAKATGKLNPRWVETLMGLPIGWTMPSCASPVTIEQTSYDCLETESCLQQPSEHSELF